MLTADWWDFPPSNSTKLFWLHHFLQSKKKTAILGNLWCIIMHCYGATNPGTDSLCWSHACAVPMLRVYASAWTVASSIHSQKCLLVASRWTAWGTKVMGVSQSVESEDEFFVPVVEQLKHNRCTARVPHQLEIRRKKGNCIYYRIVRQKLQKNKYFCVKCKLYFCFSINSNHFRKWHSECCDHYRGYT